MEAAMSRKRVKCWLCNGTGEAKITRTDVAMGQDLPWAVITVIKEEAEAAGLTAADVVGRSRVPRCVDARTKVAIRLREQYDMTLQAIGAALGGRDHSTILHSLTKKSSNGI